MDDNEDFDEEKFQEELRLERERLDKLDREFDEENQSYDYQDQELQRKELIEQFSQLKIASEEGSPENLYKLAEMYQFGNGTSQSFENAYRFYKIASSKGHEESFHRIKELQDLLSIEITNNWDKNLSSSSNLLNSNIKIPFETQINEIQSDDTHTAIFTQRMNELSFEENLIPFGFSEKGGNHCKILISKGATKATQVIVLISGNTKGTKFGQFFDGKNGSMLPYIEKALELKYGVIITNTNASTEEYTINGSESPLKHLLYLWNHILSKLTSNDISFIAYGSGCISVVSLLRSLPQELLSKTSSFAFLDSHHRLSGHSFGMFQYKDLCLQFMSKNCAKWQKSTKPINSVLPTMEGCRCFSAGTNNIFDIPSNSINAVFKFISLMKRS